MTPITERLSVSLDAEVRRMADEWFFKWHFIGRNGNGPVEIDGFRGRKICYGGIKFDGTARIVYWDTIQFYLRKKLTEVVHEVEIAIRDYPPAARSAALDEVAHLLFRFAAQIRNAAIEKDRILRGDGMNFPAPDRSHDWEDGTTDSIQRRLNGLRRIFDVPPAPAPTRGRLQSFETYLSSHKELLAYTAAGISVLFGLVRWWFGI